MGMDLVGCGGEFRFNIYGWKRIFYLAFIYGWKPAGTKPPESRVSKEKWSGTYFTNDWQEVENKDAENIAHALEKALQDIPDKTQNNQNLSLNRKNLLKFWSGKRNKDYIQKFINYCKEGGFYIG